MAWVLAAAARFRFPREPGPEGTRRRSRVRVDGVVGSGILGQIHDGRTRCASAWHTLNGGQSVAEWVQGRRGHPAEWG